MQSYSFLPTKSPSYLAKLVQPKGKKNVKKNLYIQGQEHSIVIRMVENVNFGPTQMADK